MSNYYTLVREGSDQWIKHPNNGGECCQTNSETVDELNRLLTRIKRLEDAYAAKDQQISNLLHICRDNDIEVSSYDLIHGKEAKL